MVERLLITTALQETWREQPSLFLGEWCRLYSQKDRWSRMDVEVLPYHWDDREKLYADYEYLRDFHERLLGALTAQLNGIHGVNHSLRYWRILIGPWLGYFTQMLFDRWTSIQQAVTQYDLSGTIVLTGAEEAFVPRDMADFTRLFLGDRWNHHLYAVILGRSSRAPRFEEMCQGSEGASTGVSPITWSQRIKRGAASLYTSMASRFRRDDDAFFVGTCLPVLDEIRLQRRLGQMPQRWRSVPPIGAAVDWSKRRWIVSGQDRSEFETCARALIPLQIPSGYLEGYGSLAAQALGRPWPRRPKLIWSSNSFIADEVFKAWAAEKAEGGSPLVLGQHGGHFGVGRWSFLEDHDIALSDSYLSWGWTSEAQPKVKAVGNFSRQGLRGARGSGHSGALLVTCVVPRQSYWMYSAVVAGQWLEYFSDQCTFVGHLPRAIQDALTVRLYPEDYGWDQVRRWRERFSHVRLDDARGSIKKVMRRSRLLISTYNATTYLEGFTMDVPTVVYWNPGHWELRDTAGSYFEDLRRVGIFHETPESAARHVAAIWDDVDGWWRGPTTRAVLKRFKERYCFVPADLLERVERTLREATAFSTPAVTQ